MVKNSMIPPNKYSFSMKKKRMESTSHTSWELKVIPINCFSVCNIGNQSPRIKNVTEEIRKAGLSQACDNEKHSLIFFDILNDLI